MKIFWSWQSDTPSQLNKQFVKSALEEAIKLVVEDLELSEAERPEVDHDTKGAPGLVSIVDTIFKKIEASTIFVGDVTFVGKTENNKKLLPNPNVMIELGHAITSIGVERIILVSNSAFGGKPEDLPFDLRHRRGPITFNLPEDLAQSGRASIKKKLVNDLVAALSASFGHALEQRILEIEYPMRPTCPGDRSIWLQEGEALEHQGHFGNLRKYEWDSQDNARSYLRIIPADFELTSSLRDIQAKTNGTRLLPLGPWSGADGGVNGLGIMMAGIGQERDKAIAAAQWFSETGEVWGVNRAAAYENDGRALLAYGYFPQEWWKFMKCSLDFLSCIGAKGPFKVEAGICGLKGTSWIDEYGRAYSALKDDVFLSRSDRQWNKETRVQFLCDVFGLLCDAFNQRRVDIVEFERRMHRE